MLRRCAMKPKCIHEKYNNQTVESRGTGTILDGLQRVLGAFVAQ